MGYLLILLLISFITSSVGWVYFIYFFSIGYGLSISILSVAIVVIFIEQLTLPTIILCGVLFIYGLRLSLYLFLRERRSASYRKILYQPDVATKKPLSTMLMIWLMCALLYVGQMSPVSFYLFNASRLASVSEVWAWISVALVTLGVAIEIVSDAQKSVAKRVSPLRYVDSGLYRIVRCPNYFGEILMWSGSFVICFGSYCSAAQWVIASLGYIGIIYVMFSGARRLELRQSEVYGDDPNFQLSIKRTPLLLPFVPIYSVVRFRWLKG